MPSRRKGRMFSAITVRDTSAFVAKRSPLSIRRCLQMAKSLTSNAVRVTWRANSSPVRAPGTWPRSIKSGCVWLAAAGQKDRRADACNSSLTGRSELDDLGSLALEIHVLELLLCCLEQDLELHDGACPTVLDQRCQRVDCCYCHSTLRVLHKPSAAGRREYNNQAERTAARDRLATAN